MQTIINRPVTTARYVDLAVEFLEEWLNSDTGFTDAEPEDDYDGSEQKSVGEVLVENLYLTADNSRPLRVCLPDDIRNFFIKCANSCTNPQQFAPLLTTFVEIVD